MTTWPPLRDILARGAAAGLKVAGIMLVLVALGEAVARAAFDPPRNPYTPHAYLRYVRTPGYRQTRWSCEDHPYRFEFEANSVGFRGRSMAAARKPASTYRVFFVGSSSTENPQLPEEKTFEGLVERSLNERTRGRPRVEVGNCGLGGAGILRSSILVSHFLLPLEPDLIVLLEAGNDLMTSLRDDWDPQRLLADTYTYSFNEWLCEQSQLFAVLDNRLSQKDTDTRRRSFERKRQQARSKPYFVPSFDLLRGLPTFRALLHRTALVCRDAGVPLVVMTEPTLWKKGQTKDEEEALWRTDLPGRTHLDPATCVDLMAAYNDAVRAVAAEPGVRLVDLAARVPKDLEHFIDDAHLTAKGNEAVADAVVDAVWKDGTLPRPVPESERPR